MTHPCKALAILVLTLSVTAGYAQSAAGTGDNPPPAHHHRKATKRGPSVEEQLEQLRDQMQQQASQIQTLQQQLSDRDAQLQQAQQAAQQAQAAAQQAQQAANQEQQTVTANSTAVSNLQGSVDDLKSSSSAVTASMEQVKKQTEEVKKAVENPDAIHYKGITITPAGSFIEAATVNRTAATGGGINTPLTGIPLEHSDAGQIGEFHGSARQSRIALTGTGKAGDLNVTVHYEMDWLGTGVTSNNNQSNSYVVRVRNMWARGEFDNGWGFTGGQTWSLAAETTRLEEAGTEILPGTIDPQYTAGFVWSRQYALRLTKNWGNKFAFGISAENAQALPGGSNGSNETEGEAGVGGGLYDNQATYSFNRAPDLIAKLAADPGWGHWELFGVARFFENRIYPNATATPASSAGAYNNTVTAGGVGGGFRVPFADKKISLGLKGLYGQGVGRYGDSGIVDIAFRKDGTITPVHTFSALSTVELFPTKRWYIYLNYGGDYAARDLQGGYGSYTADMSGCNTEAVPTGPTSPGGTGNCKGNNKDVQEFSAGYWYNFYKGPKGNFRYGLQYSYFDRNLWSGLGGPLNPSGGANAPDNEVETSFRYYLP
jgi:hypothetical protein